LYIQHVNVFCVDSSCHEGFGIKLSNVGKMTEEILLNWRWNTSWSTCRTITMTVLSMCLTAALVRWASSVIKTSWLSHNYSIVTSNPAVLVLSHFTYVHIHTHIRLTALFPGLPRWAGTRKAKPIWILLKQDTVSGNGISWAVCKSAPRSRQITTPAPHHSFFTGRMPFLPPNQQCQSTEGILPMFMQEYTGWSRKKPHIFSSPY